VQVKLGDVFKIPLNGQEALCKVVWISNEFEDSFGFIVFPKLNDLSQLQEGPKRKSIRIFSGEIEVLYGDIKNLEKGIWPVIGHSVVTEKELELMFHNIAGKLYHGDKFIRDLTDQELGSYPKFLRAGDQAIERVLAHAFDV
jgi:hypothetical protein